MSICSRYGMMERENLTLSGSVENDLRTTIWTKDLVAPNVSLLQLLALDCGDRLTRQYHSPDQDRLRLARGRLLGQRGQNGTHTKPIG